MDYKQNDTTWNYINQLWITNKAVSLIIIVKYPLIVHITIMLYGDKTYIYTFIIVFVTHVNVKHSHIKND